MRTLQIILLLGLSLTIFGQTKVVNMSLNNQDKTLLYVGVENDLKIISALNINTLQLKINRKILKESNGLYLYEPTASGFDTVQIYEGQKLLKTTVFKTDTIGNSILLIANMTSQTIKKNQLLSNPYLVIRKINCFYDIKCPILFFNCIINDKLFSQVSNGQFSNDMIVEINKLKSGDEIQFKDIKYGCSPNYCAKEMYHKTIKIE